MANSTKITKRDVITAMLNDENIKSNEMFVNYLNHEIELLDNKKSSRKQSATQIENIGLKNDIYTLLQEADTPMSVMDIVRLDTDKYKSPQKVTSLLNMLKNDDLIVRVEEKGKAFFKVA